MDKEFILASLDKVIDAVVKKKNSVILYCGKKSKVNVSTYLSKKISKEMPCYIWDVSEVNMGLTSRTFYDAFLNGFGREDAEYEENTTDYLKCILCVRNIARNSGKNQVCLILYNIQNLSENTISMIARIKFQLKLNYHVDLTTILVGDSKEFGVFGKESENDYDRVERAFMSFQVNIEK